MGSEKGLTGEDKRACPRCGAKAAIAAPNVPLFACLACGWQAGQDGPRERETWNRTGAIEIDPVRVELVAPQGSYVRLSSYCRHFEPRYQHFALALDAKEALALGEAMSKGLVHARLVLEWRPVTSDETEEG